MLGGHTVAHGHARVLTRSLLLLLKVLVVGHLLLLLVRHVAGVHARARHVLLRRIYVVANILGCLRGDIGGVDAIFIGSGIRSIQTCLFEEVTRGQHIAQCQSRSAAGKMSHTWMRFLPSGLVTRGCSLGVVKV